MKKETTFTAKQVGRRIKERRTELNITMPELGRRVGVNKSTISGMKRTELIRSAQWLSTVLRKRCSQLPNG